MKAGKIFFVLLITLFFMNFGMAQENETGLETIHFFEVRGCPDCARQKEFLEEVILDEYPNVEIIEYSIMDSKNQEKFHQMMEEKGIKEYRLMTPTTFIGENVFQNFYEEDKELIKRAIEGENVQNEIYEVRGKNIVKAPFIGEIDLGDWSLPLAAFVIGSLDGLNVCSIGALILILMIVLGFKSRKKVLFYGGLFILTAVIIYGLLVFAWTALFTALATYIGFINIIIGLAAFAGGVFFLNKFIKFYKYGPACEYSGNKFVINATNKLKEAFENEKSQFLFLTASVITFAAVITLVELPCSFGLPMVYGGILAGTGLSWAGYVFYIMLYLFFYMLIELIIFAGAVITKEVWFSESNMITWVYGLGTLVLFFLSYYYLIGI